jgi:hypothetical protein
VALVHRAVRNVPLQVGDRIGSAHGASGPDGHYWGVPLEHPIPTDATYEMEQGRVALWLDPDDLRWLAARCWCDDDTGKEERDRCARVRFRASAALHKAGAEGSD